MTESHEKILYLQCESGISGDMTVGALLNLGASEDVLRKALVSLPLTGYEIRISQVQKAGLATTDFLVQLDATHKNHDHDMNYLYGFQHGVQESHHHHHHEELGHHHDHAQEQVAEKEHQHHHEHRTFQDVKAILEAGQLSAGALTLAEKIFAILGEAEAKAHGTTLDAVHFHEVGAVDSIVDIAATAVCLDNLGIQEVVIPVLNEGKGSVRCAHGILPIPVPAVAAIAAQYHLPLSIMDAAGEYVTPTGAAIAAAIATTNTLPHRFTIEKSVWALANGNRNAPACSERCSWPSRKKTCLLKKKQKIQYGSWKPIWMIVLVKRWGIRWNSCLQRVPKTWNILRSI